MSKFFLFFVFIFIYSRQAFSQEKNFAIPTKIQGSKNLPLELNLLLESLQDSNDENQIKYLDETELNSLFHIDSYARTLSKEDIFLIGKIEIYKTILKTNANYPQAFIDSNSIKTLSDSIKNSTDPFITWFLKALLQDCQHLLGSDIYHDYLLQKNSETGGRVEFKKINKKVTLIYRWVSIIKRDSPDFQEILKRELVPLMDEALKNIEESFFLMASNTLFQSMPVVISSLSEFKFFQQAKVNEKKTIDSKKEKSVEDILAPVTNENTQHISPLPKPIQDNWLDNDLAPDNLKNLPKPADDADWLQDL